MTPLAFILPILLQLSSRGSALDNTDAEDVKRYNACLDMASKGACNLDPILMDQFCTDVCSEDRFNKKDKLDQCQRAAKQHECLTNARNMWRDCPESCGNAKGIRKVEMRRLTTGLGAAMRVDEENSFFGLQARKMNGDMLDFEDFVGSITLVVNIANMPDERTTREFYRELELMKKRHKDDLEIVAFPFSTDESQKCFVHESESIHVMEDAKINFVDGTDHKDNQHPIYQYFQSQFQYNGLSSEFATWFLINQSGGIIEAHHGGDPSHMMVYIEQHLKQDVSDKWKEIDNDNRIYGSI